MAGTISDVEWRKLRDRATRHEIEHGGGALGEAATRRRKASRPDKAGTN